MNMNKNKMFIIAGLLIIISSLIILIPPYDCIFDYANSIATILSCLCTLFTLLIAISIYDKYGLSGKSYSETFNSVISLYHDVSKLDFFLKTYDIELSSNPNDISFNRIIIIRNNFKLSNIKEYAEGYLDLPVLFTESYIYSIQILDNYQSSLFIPKQIKEALDKFYIVTYMKYMDKPKKGTVIESPENEKKTEEVDYYKIDSFENLKTFIESYGRLKRTIYDWLKKNGGDKEIINMVI